MTRSHRFAAMVSGALVVSGLSLASREDASVVSAHGAASSLKLAGPGAPLGITQSGGCNPDTQGPDITCSAVTRSCTPLVPEGGLREAEPRMPRTVSRADLEAILVSTASSEEARLRIAEKLDILPRQVQVFDGADPMLRSQPNQALSCPTPCTGVFTVLEANNPFYDVFLSCDNGDFTARTGAMHSVTALAGGNRQNVIYGGAGGNPGTSDITWHVHSTGANFLDPLGAAVCAFDPPDTPSEPDNVGLEAEWSVATGGFDLRLREEIVAFGSLESNSGIRITLGATNLPTSSGTVNMGVRWQTDYQNASDDGPLYADVTCDPFSVGPERSTEHEFTPLEIKDFYRIRNNEFTPRFSNYTNTTPIVGFPGTGTPDRLVYGSWPSMVNSGWNRVTNEGDTNPDNDSATLYYFGYLPANGIQLAPGESFSRSLVIFTSGSDQAAGRSRRARAATRRSPSARTPASSSGPRQPTTAASRP